jgi:hypothetical protein
LSSGFQRITGYITPGYFNEEPGISPLDISIKNWVYHPQIFQRRTGYITPRYFKEELSDEITEYITPRIF